VATSLEGIGAERDRTALTGRWLALWHLTSLDAPVVAAVWTWFLARSLRVAISPAVPAAMFVAVWLLYAVDRLLDGSTGVELELRHHYHQQHRRAFLVGVAVAVVAIVPLVLMFPLRLLLVYAGLGIALLIWFGVIHVMARGRAQTLPKEVGTSLFFAAAVVAPAWSGVGSELSPMLAAGGCAVLVSALNCLYIFAWEHPGTTGQSAHWSTQVGVRNLLSITVASVVILLVAAVVFGPEMLALFLSAALSAGLLLTLDRHRSRIDRTDLRALADAALLTPLLVGWLLR
jgi:hypothetical protein